MIHYLIELDTILRDLVMWYGDVKSRNNRSFDLTHLYFEFDGNLEIRFIIDDHDKEMVQGIKHTFYISISDNIALALINGHRQTDSLINSFKKFQKLCNDELTEYNSRLIKLAKGA